MGTHGFHMIFGTRLKHKVGIESTSFRSDKDVELVNYLKLVGARRDIFVVVEIFFGSCDQGYKPRIAPRPPTAVSVGVCMRDGAKFLAKGREAAVVERAALAILAVGFAVVVCGCGQEEGGSQRQTQSDLW